MNLNPQMVMALGAIPTWGIVMIVISVILLAALIALGFYGKKLQDKQNTTQQEMEAAAQNVSLLVIDKKRMKLRDAGLPAIVVEQTPKYLRGSKLPIVKAKVGPRIMTLICDEKVYELIPIKKEVKARVSGIYIIGVKGVRSNLETKPKKKSIKDRLPWNKSK